MNFNNVTGDLSHVVIYIIIIMELRSKKNVRYFDLVAITMQDLLAKNFNKRNPKTKCCMLTILG